MKVMFGRREIELLTVGAAAWLFLQAWSYHAGLDYNWDQLNYHVYAGLSSAGDRLTQDFFPASIQSYLNPYSFLPFYWLVRSDAPSLFVGIALASIHSLNILLVHAIAQRLMPQPSLAMLRCASSALAILTPVFLIEVGTSFNDVLVSIPFLAAVLLVLSARAVTDWRVLAAGLLSGVSVGLKLTNAPFSLALCAAIALTSPSLLEATRRFAVHGISTGAGFLAVNSYWSWRLYQEFGNPFFPFFNSLFAAPDFPSVTISIYRFIPESWLDAIAIPFLMLLPRRDIYTEVSAPEGKLAFVVILVVFVVIGRFLSKQCKFRSRPASLAIVFILLALPLWMMSSGNGRYALPLLLLAAPVCVLLIVQIARSPRWRIYAVGSMLGVQAVGVYFGTDARWSESHWGTSPWFQVAVPEVFASSPGLYLSLDTQPAAFLAAFAHPNSSFVSVVGLNSLSPDGPGGGRVKELMQRHSGAVFALFPVFELDESNRPRMERAGLYNETVAPFGLRMLTGACNFVRVDGLPSRRRMVSQTGTVIMDGNGPFSLFAYCATERVEVSRDWAEKREDVNSLFSLAEARCPQFFSPSQTQMYAFGDEWHKRYVNTDAHLIIGPRKTTVLSHHLRPAEVYRRSPAEVLPQDFVCPSPRSGRRMKLGS